MYKETPILPTKSLLKGYMKMLNLPHLECESWTSYMDKLLSLPESSEKCVYQMLQFPMCNAFLPLEELLPGRIQVPVHFCYGGPSDWMCSEGAKKLITNNLIKGTYTEFEHFNHQFPFFNPAETSEYILNL